MLVVDGGGDGYGWWRCWLWMVEVIVVDGGGAGCGWWR